MAPFIIGLSTIFSLYFFSGYSANFHLISVFSILLILHGITIFSSKKYAFFKQYSFEFEEYYFGVLLLVWIFFLFFNSFYYPLYQNDALEYMTVARQLFITNSLSSTPMINQEITSSGFYGPWTHPPLYVALLYLTKIIQGHALYPGLARIISPWAACLILLIIYSLGAIRSRLTGVIGCLVCISSPLFFFGATSSLIDSLAILGFILTITFLIGIDSKYTLKWGAVGLVTGLSLWSHSEAILLLPILFVMIFLMFGLKQWRKSLVAILIVFSVSLLISAWPYIGNWLNFGSVVSDNPEIFALPHLKWDEYFDYARGLNNRVAILQYGIFKGWFTIEAFGFSFWFMTFGAIVYIRQLYSSYGFKTPVMLGCNILPKQDLLLILCLAFIVLYLGGTIASVLLGMNLMIKNERYLLVALPFVSIIAGYAGSYIIQKLNVFFQADFQKYFYYFISVILFSILLLEIILLAIVYPGKYIPENEIIINPIDLTVKSKSESVHRRLLKSLPATGLMLKAGSILPKNALILSFRPADLYYLKRKMVSFLDPRLVPLYKEDSTKNAIAMLKALGIDYINTTDYSLPAVYNSIVSKIIEDPSLSKLIVSYLANDIYQLTPSNDQFKLMIDFTPGKIIWSYYKGWNFMGRKSLLKLMPVYSKFSFIKENKLLNFKKPIAINHRNYSHFLISNVAPVINQDRFRSKLLLEPTNEYRVNFDLEGEGFVRFYMLEFDANNDPIKYFNNSQTFIRISEVVLSKTRNTINVSKRFIARGKRVLFVVEIMGSSELRIKKAELYKLEKG